MNFSVNEKKYGWIKTVNCTINQQNRCLKKIMLYSTQNENEYIDKLDDILNK